MWFLNMPTGLLLIALSPLLPESARFLQHVGRGEEARAMLARFGSRVQAVVTPPVEESHSHLPPVDRRHLAITVALTLAALSWDETFARMNLEMIVGSCGVIAIILPYPAENYPLRIRGRATGWVAGCSKLGGLFAQGLSVLAIAPPLGAAAAAVGGLTVVSLGLIAFLGRETRGRDLRDLEDPD